MADYEEDLREYASDGEFDDRYVDDGADKDMSNVIVVDNLPIVPEAKFQKLHDFVAKIYGAIGKIVEGGINMPLNKASAESEGFAFIEFATKADAEAAIQRTDGWDFDKAHKLAVNRYTDFMAYAKEPEKFTAPNMAVPPPREDTNYWLMDEGCRDEFAIRWAAPGPGGHEAQMTEVLWADTRGPPLMDYGGDRQRAAGRYWTERMVQWSPRGSFLVTYHPQGAVLWGGRGFQEHRRLAHPGINDVTFSPDERFAVSWNGRYGNTSPERAGIVWDLRTQQELRAFRQLRPHEGDCDLVWSADSRFLARVAVDPSSGQELVYVYEMPSVTLLDQRSIKAPGARELSWCPGGKTALLAWWAPEKENAPTSVTVMRLPGREILRQRNLFNVDSCELRWHPQGAFLAVMAAKSKKNPKKKGDKSAPVERRGIHGFTLEFFRLRDKAVGVEVMEVKERVVDLVWEPGTASTRFVLVAESVLQPNRYTIGLYEMGDKGVPHLLLQLEDKPYNLVSWSPGANGIVVMAATLSPSAAGALEFFDVNAKKSLATAEHSQASDVAWDPSGRMLASWKAQPLGREASTRETVQNGFQLWSFQGARIFETERAKMFQFSWRPRPEGLLTDEEAKDVARNLKKHIARYQEEDRRVEERRKLLERLRKRKLRDDFHAFLATRHASWLAERAARVAMGAEEPEGSESITIIEQVVEIELGDSLEEEKEEKEEKKN